MPCCSCLHFSCYCNFLVVAVVQRLSKLKWLSLSHFQSENYWKNLGNVFSCFWTCRANVKQFIFGDAWTTCWKFNFTWSDLGHVIILPFYQVLPLLLINFMVRGELFSSLLCWTRLSLSLWNGSFAGAWCVACSKASCRFQSLCIHRLSHSILKIRALTNRSSHSTIHMISQSDSEVSNNRAVSGTKSKIIYLNRNHVINSEYVAHINAVNMHHWCLVMLLSSLLSPVKMICSQELSALFQFCVQHQTSTRLWTLRVRSGPSFVSTLLSDTALSHQPTATSLTSSGYMCRTTQPSRYGFLRKVQ